MKKLPKLPPTRYDGHSDSFSSSLSPSVTLSTSPSTSISRPKSFRVREIFITHFVYLIVAVVALATYSVIITILYLIK